MSNPSEDKKTNIILAALGVIPVVWAALMVAPFLSDGLAGIIEGFTSGMADPMEVKWCVDSLKAILIFLLIYGLGIGVYLSTKRNYRKGEEHGSAKWGNASQLSKKYADKNRYENIILTQNTRIGLDGRKHRRNLNVLVCGGSGAGKTRFYAKPNIMQANSSGYPLPKGRAARHSAAGAAPRNQASPWGCDPYSCIQFRYFSCAECPFIYICCFTQRPHRILWVPFRAWGTETGYRLP